MKIDFELLKTIDRDLYGDAMLVLILMGNNMAAENQQTSVTDVLLQKGWIYLSMNSENIIFLIPEMFK